MSNQRGEQTILGEAPEFLYALEHVSNAAKLSKPVLILGERGTGKELFSSRLHFLSPRWGQPLVKVNCAALTESILESELFGHEAGAFTGASARHIGRFERADNGTLFLDELGTIPRRMQEKILRVIEYGEFERVGGSETIQVDVRIVGATNANLPELAASDHFRSDLLDRLAFDVINVPPLRYRKPDIELLANFFAVSITSDLGRAFFPGFTDAAFQLLHGYQWPGNVRELKNVVERSVYRNSEPEEPVNDLIINPFRSSYKALSETPEPGPAPSARSAEEPLDSAEPEGGITPTLPCELKAEVAKFEQQALNSALRMHKYHQGHAAKSLGLSYHQFRAYLKKHGVEARPD